LTTLAIIGAGIAGRSLIYALAKSKKNFSKIIVFDSDQFTQTCSYRSTAIVAPRGVSSGHSDLGDLIVKGLETFQSHIKNDHPNGVFKITQYTGAVSKLEMFKKRYPDGEGVTQLGSVILKNELYVAKENAYLIDPMLYLNWLKDQSHKLPVEWKNAFVISIKKDQDLTEIKTSSGETILVDQLVVTGGAYNRFWQPRTFGKPIQGSYFEFHDVDLGNDSFSLTLEGDNIVYHAHTKKMLMGSTTLDLGHVLPERKELDGVYERLAQKLETNLPSLNTGFVITGLREKAAKRRPYLYQDNNIFWLGGLYKNGFSLSLHLAQDLVGKL
jgi:glycine/D-amino acid oxidase-like deaminating enzyme